MRSYLIPQYLLSFLLIIAQSIAFTNSTLAQEVVESNETEYESILPDFFGCFQEPSKECLQLCLSVRNQALVNKDTFVLMESYILESLIHEQNKEYDQALKICHAAHSFCLANQFEISCKSCSTLNKMLANYQASMGQYKEAATTLRQIQKCDCLSPISFILVDYHIAEYLLEDHQFDSANFFIEDMVRRTEELADTSHIIAGYSNSGMITLKAQDYDGAIELFEKAINLIDNSGYNQPLKPIVMGNIGNCYFQKGELDVAYPYLEYDSRENIKFKQFESHAMAELLLAEIDLLKDQAEQARDRLFYLKENHFDRLNDSYQLKLQELIFEAELRSNTSHSVYELILNHKKEIDRIVNRENEKKNALLSAYFNTIYQQSLEQLNDKQLIANQNYELAIEKEEKGNQQLIFISIFAGLICLIAPILVLRYRNQKRRYELFEKQQKLLIQEQLLLKEAQEELLEIKLKKKQKETKALSVELANKEQFAENLIAKLKQLNSISPSDMMSLMFFVRSELSNRNELNIEEVNKVSEEFLFTVKQMHLDLTDLDLKLCVFIVLNLSNKEIAYRRNISVNSVKVAKNRLKKKLRLSSEEDVHQYLAQFL